MFIEIVQRSAAVMHLVEGLNVETLLTLKVKESLAIVIIIIIIILKVKNLKEIIHLIWPRTCDLLACSIVPQPLRCHVSPINDDDDDDDNNNNNNN
jgi:hypothetical protein